MSKNEIGFEFLEAIDNTKKIIIDPWVAPITTLTATGLGNNRGYDVDYDYQGNLFVYGGGNYAPFWFITSENTRVAKYSPSGVLLWTFNGSVATPFWQSKGSSGYMSNFVVDKVYGKTYVGQVLIPSGCAIIRLDTNGAYDNFISTPNPNFVEIWEMNFDCRTGNILGMGGSISSNKQIGIVNSTGSFSPQNITGNISAYQDILSSTVTNSGELFVAIATGGNAALNNKIAKVNNTLNGNIWITSTGFSSFAESANKPYFGYATSNGFNALYANSSYLFYYDGLNVKAFDKANGTSVGSPIAISGHTLKYQGGIYADECNNVYVGGDSGKINVFHFNGATFSILPDINLPNIVGKHIYDIKYNSWNNLLYISGETFVATIPRSQICVDTVSINAVINDDCNSSKVHVLNGDTSAQYTYIWTDSITNILQSHVNVHSLSDTMYGLLTGHVYNVQIIHNDLCGSANRLLSFTQIDTPRIINNVSICYGQSITVNGQTYTQSGIYQDTLITTAGCYSIVTTNLTVLQNSNLVQTFSLCDGQSLTVNGNNYSTSGTYVNTLINSIGCDSIITTHLTILQNSNLVQTFSLCVGQTITVNGHVYSTTGIYIDTLINTVGCDSIIHTNLTINLSSFYTQNLTLCNGDSVIVNGHSYFSSGIFIDTLANAAGCDSVVTTHLTILQNSSLVQYFSACEGQTIIVNGHTYSTTGIYVDTMINAVGCDSIIITNLTIIPTVFYSQNFTRCDGDSVVVNGHSYFSSGVYIDTIVNGVGCNTIITTHLTVNPFITKSNIIQLCEGECLIINGHSYNTTGVYIDTIKSQFTCDTIVSTNLTLFPKTSSTQQFKICEGESVDVNGHAYTASGNFMDTVLNSNGCDSVIFTNVEVEAIAKLSQEISICNGNSLTINHHSYSSSGTYIDTLKNGNGCDSILITKLNVNSALSENIFISNAFSPNNDNLNDCFGVTYWKDIQEMVFLIYNRWGQVVFKTNQAWNCWDGNYKGELAAQGVYYYYIKVKTSCGNAEYKGDVTLLR